MKPCPPYQILLDQMIPRIKDWMSSLEDCVKTFLFKNEYWPAILSKNNSFPYSEFTLLCFLLLLFFFLNNKPTWNIDGNFRAPPLPNVSCKGAEEKNKTVVSQKKNSTVSKFRSQDIDTWLSFFVAFTWILDALGILPDQEKTLNRKFLQQEWGQSLGM